MRLQSWQLPHTSKLLHPSIDSDSDFQSILLKIQRLQTREQTGVSNPLRAGGSLSYAQIQLLNAQH